MANPNMIQTVDGDLVDIDDVSVDILIVAKNPAAFQQSATFLSRRGWPTTVVGNLSKAIDFIVKNNPDFILISCNHPNPNISRLHIIVEQTEGSTCIAFAEVNDAVSGAKLTNSPIRHKIQGLPSGPNIQRLIRKLMIEGDDLKPLFHAKDEDSAKARREVSGEAPAKKKGRRRLKEVLGREIRDNGKKSELLALSKVSETNRGESGMIFLPTKAEEIDPSEEDFVAEGATDSAENEDLMQSATIDDDGDIQQEGSDLVDSNPMIAEDRESDEVKHFEAAQKEVVHLSYEQPKPAEGQSVFSDDPIVMTTNHKAANDFKGSEGRRKYLSILEKSIEQTLNKLCPDQDKRATPLSTITDIGVIPMNSVGLHGYLIVCGSGKLTEFHKEFVTHVKANLKKALANNGFDMTLEDELYLQTDPFQFVAWSKIETELAYTANHKGIEIGIGFLPTAKPLSGAPVRGRSDMAKILPEDITPNQRVSFKAYLYFKKSNKFYLYLRNGRILYEDQLQRLAEKKISELFIKKIDVKNFRFYSAGFFIRASITRSKIAKAS